MKMLVKKQLKTARVRERERERIIKKGRRQYKREGNKIEKVTTDRRP